MLRVDAKQGAPKDGHYPLERFHVIIFFSFNDSLGDFMLCRCIIFFS